MFREKAIRYPLDSGFASGASKGREAAAMEGRTGRGQVERHGDSLRQAARGLWLALTLAMLSAAGVMAAGPEAASKDLVLPVPKGDIQLTKDVPFKDNAAGPSLVTPGSAFQLRYTVHVLDAKHYVYKEMMGVSFQPVEGITFGPVQFSREPETKYDQFEERQREIYHATVTMFVDAKVAANAALGPRTIEATVKYQGCNPSTCFMPAKKKQVLTVTVSNKQADAADHVPASGEAQASAAGAAGPEGVGAALTKTADTGAAGVPAAPAGAAEAVAGASGAATGAAAGVTSGAADSAEAADPVEEEKAVAVAGKAPGSSAGGSDGSVGSGPGGGSGSSSGSEASASVRSSVEGGSSSSGLPIDPSKGLLWTFLVVFGMGILASFTPCVYPIIPITVSVLGARQAGSRVQGFFLALVYVVGLSTTYTLLGVFAAKTGALFGGVMQNVYVLSAISVLFIGMGFGMMGAFEVAMPSGVTSRLAGVRGRGFPGAFVMGAIAGLVASPCIGPLIVSLLTYIAQTGNVTLGAALMFTFALGMGQLFLVLGTFAINMPRSGAWMDKVKGGLALMLFGVGLYYLQFVIPTGYYELLLGASALAAGVFVGAFDGLTEESSTGARINKSLGILLVLIGLYSVVGGMLQTRVIAPMISVALLDKPAAGPVQAVAQARIEWKSNYQASIDEARAGNKPVMIDFTASWCAACKELEHETFSDQKVIDIASEFVTIRVDGTNDTPEFLALKEQFGILGLPYVVFIDKEGNRMTDETITGFVPPEELRRRLCRVGATASKELADACGT